MYGGKGDQSEKVREKDIKDQHVESDMKKPVSFRDKVLGGSGALQ